MPEIDGEPKMGLDYWAERDYYPPDEPLSNGELAVLLSALAVSAAAVLMALRAAIRWLS